MLKLLFLSNTKLLADPDLERLSTQHSELVKQTKRWGYGMGLGSALACLTALLLAHYQNDPLAVDKWAGTLVICGVLSVGLTVGALAQLRRVQPLASAPGTPCEESLRLTRAHPRCHAYVQEVLAQGRQLLAIDLSHLQQLRHQAQEDVAQQATLVRQRALGTSPQAEAHYDRLVRRINWEFVGSTGMFAATALYMLTSGPSRPSAFLWLVPVLGWLALFDGMRRFQTVAPQLPVWRSKAMNKAAAKLLRQDTPGGRYLRDKRAQGQVLLVSDFYAASDLDSPNAHACKELHQCAPPPLDKEGALERKTPRKSGDLRGVESMNAVGYR